MSLPTTAYTDFTSDLRICRILNGMWQVSGAHGLIVPQQALAEMTTYINAGFTTWDLADHYGPAEDFIAAWHRQWSSQRGMNPSPAIQAFTKWVPRPGPMPRRTVVEAVQRSLRRMDVPVLDVLQFHWWDYQDHRYLDALQHLADLQAAGKIKHLALTNFDTAHLQTIVEAGIPIVSNQVQFSVIDQRPLVAMAQFCQQRGIQLLAYGVLGGGLLSERFLGQPEPSRLALNTASLRKYKTIIESWGDWPLFQELLAAIATIAQRHRVSLANVAVRYVLEQPTVAGVIIGARLGVSQHLAENARVFEFALQPEDYDRIYSISDRARDLFDIIGDCGDEYRR
jgi:aryl-alcohol dehydrogenase-like predicted oxidoreductase